MTKSPCQVNVHELNLLLPEEIFETPLWKSLLRGIRAAFFPTKQPPLVLTSKPLDIGELLGDSLERPLYPIGLHESA